MYAPAKAVASAVARPPLPDGAVADLAPRLARALYMILFRSVILFLPITRKCKRHPSNPFSILFLMGGSLTWQGSDNRTQGELTATRDAINEETTQLYAASISLLADVHSWVSDSGSPTSSHQQQQVKQVHVSVRTTLVQVTTGAVLAQTISACLALAQVRLCRYSCCPVRCTSIIVPSPFHTLASKCPNSPMCLIDGPT